MPKPAKPKKKKKPITPTQIGRRFNLTRARASQMVNHEGCPTDSWKNIDAWRKMRQVKREATNPKKDCKFAEDGLPALERRAISNTGDSLMDALQNAIAVAQGAFEAYEDARVGRLSTRSARLSEHNKALEGHLKAEKAYREEQERRDILVNKNVVLEQCRRCLDQVLKLIKKLPTETGPQCNRADPLTAVKILEKACASIMAAGREALNGLPQ